MSKSIHRELTVPSDTTYLAQVRAAVIEVVGKDLFPPAKAGLIALAVDEAVANIMEHAYPPGSDGGKIDVVLDANAKRFEVLIRDRGLSFDPRVAPDVDMQEHVKAGKKGGLGIFLMRRIMDEINYSYRQGVHNELQMIKYVDEKEAKTKS
jgi:anti-sigma regulatory factor (Ser/Thr protein kinase)